MDDKAIRATLRVAVAGFLILAVWGLAAPSASAQRDTKGLTREHYRVAIDPKVALKDLLPIPPENVLPTSASIMEDLARVPELTLNAPVSAPKAADSAEARVQGMVQIARLTTHINFLNKHKTDRFVELLVENRPDLAGIPFAMGDACRLKEEDRRQFMNAVDLLRLPLGHDWKEYDERRYKRPFHQLEDRFCAAAGLQILAVEAAEVRLGLVRHLAAFDETDRDKNAATQALTNLAIFSQEAKVRRAAAAALLKRNQGADVALLLRGLRYPWPSVAQNTAELVSELNHRDFIPELIKMLDEPDPRAPALQEVKGKKTAVLREVVRINHHRNCLLCHPPANTPDVMVIHEQANAAYEVEKGVAKMLCRVTVEAEDVLLAAVPTPGVPLPSVSPSGSAYYSRVSPFPDTSPGILVRADITYLRQDFSLLQKVADADPWPEMQRYDYLVRTRALTEQQTAAYHAEFAKRETLSPYRQAALAALRSLTRQDAGRSATAWRDALGMK